MTQRSLVPFLVPALFALAACAAPGLVIVPSSGTPVYDKFGGVSFCIGPDGQDYPADRSSQTPCEEPSCPGGVVSPAGEVICPEDTCPGGIVSPSGEVICPEDLQRPGSGGSGDRGGRGDRPGTQQTGPAR